MDQHQPIAAVVRISYDRPTGQIEIIGRRQQGGTPARIAERGYEVVESEIAGWGDYDVLIHTDGGTVYPDPLDGWYLAKLATA